MIDASTIGLSEGQLRRQGLESLTSVLRSLVSWGTTTGKTPVDTNMETARVQVGDDTGHEAMASDPSLDRTAATSGNVEALRQPTPDTADDPTRFESAKQKKTSLLEGIKKFNFKPKRVINPSLSTRLPVLITLIRVFNFSLKLVSFQVYRQPISHGSY